MTRDEFIAETAARLIAARIITYSGAVDEACFLAGRLEECGVAPWQDDETVGIEAVELCRQAVKAECAAKEAALRDLADLRAKLDEERKACDEFRACMVSCNHLVVGGTWFDRVAFEICSRAHDARRAGETK